MVKNSVFTIYMYIVCSFSFKYVCYSENAICTYNQVIQKEVTLAQPYGLTESYTYTKINTCSHVCMWIVFVLVVIQHSGGQLLS